MPVDWSTCHRKTVREPAWRACSVAWYSTVGAAVAVAAVVVVDVVVVVVVTGAVLLDVLTTQLGAEPDCDVQFIVDPVLNVLLVHTGAVPSEAVQSPVELLLDALEPEPALLVLEVQVVMAPLPDIVTVHPGRVVIVFGALMELLGLEDPLVLELDDPLLLKLDDPPLLKLDDPPLDDPPLLELDDPPLLELDDPPLLKLDEPLPELAELLLVEPDELSLADTELSCARAICAGEIRPRPAGSAVAPATSSTPTGRASRRAGENFIRSFVRNLTVKPFRGSVRPI